MNAKIAAAEAITNELAKAQSKFAPFNSDHEGWAVVKEEAEELHEDFAGIARAVADMWTAVRRNDRDMARACAESIASHAVGAAAEAIQVGAMAQRYLADLPGAEDAA